MRNFVKFSVIQGPKYSFFVFKSLVLIFFLSTNLLTLTGLTLLVLSYFIIESCASSSKNLIKLRYLMPIFRANLIGYFPRI